jgi:predicted metal-binding protein
MHQWSFQHKTPSALITINAKSLVVPAKSLIDYENKSKFTNMCKAGCKNYNNNWSCPPFSPSYTQLAVGYSNLLLLLLYCNLDQLSYINDEYSKVSVGNDILKSVTDKSLRQMEQIYDGVMISNGSCRLCKTCTRKLKMNKCKKPAEMRYGMGSLGLNVDKISSELFEHELSWYRKNHAPLYISAVSALLTNSDIKWPIFQLPGINDG